MDPEPPSDEAPSAEPSSKDGMVGAVRKAKLRAALFDEPLPEQRLGRYRVVGTLGRGGMGTVLEAVDDALERRVALKLLHRDVSPRDRGRLLREARALARLSHPHVVQVHEVGEQPRPFIAMELVRGQTLAQWQRQRPPWRACVRAYIQAGRGLAAAHAQRLVHRDFKPSNCIIDEEGRVRVMDFGLARSLEPGARAEDAPTSPLHETMDISSTDEATLTDTGAVLGTPAYMPLEQLLGKEVDARSDQFGFCVALHEALHGVRPFPGRTIAELEQSMLEGRTVVPPRDARVPAALRRVLLRGLAAEPERRWPTMDALLVELERLVRPRWRARLGLATVLGGLGLAGASVWNELDTAQACEGVERQLADAWSAARRDQLEGALRGSPLPYAQAAWEGVAPRLDAYATAWIEAAREVCEEARIRREQPESVVALRTACLDARKLALGEAVDVLVEAEPASVERAVSLVTQLPPLDRCDDVPALLAAIPPPEDLLIRARVDDLRGELARARALRIAGRYADGLEVAEQVAQAAEGLDYAALSAEASLARGWALYGAGRSDEAVVAYEDAYARAAAVGHDAVASDAASMLSFIVGTTQAKPEVGLKWSMTARAHALRPGAEPGAEALALSNAAAVYLQRGDLEQARSSYERALAQQEQALGPDDVRLAFTLNGLGVVHTSLGQLDQAAAYHQRALEVRRSQLGAHHPHVAMSLNNLGVVAHGQGRFEDAVGYMREALELKEGLLGPDHPELASSLANVGTLLHMAGNNDAAVTMLERASAIVERVDGPQSGRLEGILYSLGTVQQAQGRLEQAEATLRRALAIGEHVHGPTHPELIVALVNLAEVVHGQGRSAEGLRHAARARELAKALPADSAHAVEPILMQARLTLAQGDAAAAATLAEDAVTRFARSGAPPPRIALARLLWSEAVAAIEPPQRERALAIVEQALAELEPHGDPQSAEIREHLLARRDELTRPDPPR